MIGKLPDRAILREMFYYEPETGYLYWRRAKGTRGVGARAGSTSKHGYRRVKIDRHYYAEHRLIFLIVTGAVPDIIDHRDGNRSNNKWENLRSADGYQSAVNQARRKSNTTGFKGVCFNKRVQKFQAQIRYSGKRRYLGLFSTAEDAHLAYCHAADELHLEFANHG